MLMTDALDDFCERMNWQTYLGTILDPVADKLLLSGTIFFYGLTHIFLYIYLLYLLEEM